MAVRVFERPIRQNKGLFERPDKVNAPLPRNCTCI